VEIINVRGYIRKADSKSGKIIKKSRKTDKTLQKFKEARLNCLKAQLQYEEARGRVNKKMEKYYDLAKQGKISEEKLIERLLDIEEKERIAQLTKKRIDAEKHLIEAGLNCLEKNLPKSKRASFKKMKKDLKHPLVHDKVVKLLMQYEP